jgi:glutamate synthase domain-containing protein 3
MEINAAGIYYRDLNNMIRQAVSRGEDDFVLSNINGQRYIGNGISRKIKLLIKGTPGQDMAAFMKGPEIVVEGNAQDGIGNTMDDGKIVVRGMAGDIVGYGMRGGQIYVGGDVGYRVGIHMKSFEEKIPVIVIGGKAGDFLGEYMAGGIIILLGMLSQSEPEQPLAGNFLGTGMHGGAIYTRGPVDKHSLGKGLGIKEACPPEISSIKPYLEEFGRQFDFELDEILKEKFYCIYPTTHRPYGNMYAY